jgi:hypothetical protein
MSQFFRTFNAKDLWSKITKAISKGTPAFKITDLLAKATATASSLFKGPNTPPPPTPPTPPTPPPPKVEPNDAELMILDYNPTHPGPSVEARRTNTYDRFPLVIRLKNRPDGFDGINLHYMNPRIRDEIVALIQRNGTLSAAERFEIGAQAIAYRAYATYFSERIRYLFPLDANMWPAIKDLPGISRVNWGEAEMALAKLRLRRGLNPRLYSKEERDQRRRNRGRPA